MRYPAQIPEMRNVTTNQMASWIVVSLTLYRQYASFCASLSSPLGYYMAAQGSLAIFVIEIAIYAYLMNQKDEEFGIREEG